MYDNIILYKPTLPLYLNNVKKYSPHIFMKMWNYWLAFLFQKVLVFPVSRSTRLKAFFRNDQIEYRTLFLNDNKLEEKFFGGWKTFWKIPPLDFHEKREDFFVSSDTSHWNFSYGENLEEIEGNIYQARGRSTWWSYLWNFQQLGFLLPQRGYTRFHGMVPTPSTVLEIL